MFWISVLAPHCLLLSSENLFSLKFTVKWKCVMSQVYNTRCSLKLRSSFLEFRFEKILIGRKFSLPMLPPSMFTVSHCCGTVIWKISFPHLLRFFSFGCLVVFNIANRLIPTKPWKMRFLRFYIQAKFEFRALSIKSQEASRILI